MKQWKSNLDERQEQVLLQIEHRAFWLGYWGLLAAMTAQVIIYGFDFGHIVGEWIIFMALSLYIAFACAKNGIWDRYLKPNAKTNVILSLIAGAAVGALQFAAVLSRFPDAPLGAAAAGIMTGAVVLVLCFIALSAMARYAKRRQKKLEDEPEDDV